jgi:hypothetical protein
VRVTRRAASGSTADRAKAERASRAEGRGEARWGEAR